MTHVAPDVPGDPGSAGFSLIELVVSLALFALISLAGISLVETVAGVQERTAGRADRLGELQRALFLITADFEQVTGGPEHDGDRLVLDRSGRSGAFPVAYRLHAGSLHRAADGVDRAVIRNVSTVGWRYFKNGTWVDRPTSKEDMSRPRAVEMVIVLSGGPRDRKGTLRRVFDLSAER